MPTLATIWTTLKTIKAKLLAMFHLESTQTQYIAIGFVVVALLLVAYLF